MLLETNQILQKAEDVDEILEKTANQIVKLFGRTAIFYRNTKEGLKAPVLYPVNPKIDENRYLSEQEYKAAAEVLKQNGRGAFGSELYVFSGWKYTQDIRCDRDRQ